MPHLKYLRGYPAEVLEQVRRMADENKLGEYLTRKYPDAHAIKTDKALYQYVMALKQQHMRNAALIDRVAYDNKLDVMHHALGLHTVTRRVQGANLKASRAIRIGSVFREAPAKFLHMIVVHELAHLKERDHDRAFYQLCEHMLPGYGQLEFDLRVYLVWRDQPDKGAKDTAEDQRSR